MHVLKIACFYEPSKLKYDRIVKIVLTRKKSYPFGCSYLFICTSEYGCIKNIWVIQGSSFQAFFIYLQYVILRWWPRRQPGYQASTSGCPATGETRKAREEGSPPSQGRAPQRPPQKPWTSEPRGAQKRASTTQVLHDHVHKCREIVTMSF